MSSQPRALPIALQLDYTHAHLPVSHAVMHSDEWFTLSLSPPPPILCLRFPTHQYGLLPPTAQEKKATGQ